MYCKKQYTACSINVQNTGCAESMIVIQLLPLRPMDLLDAKTSSRCGAGVRGSSYEEEQRQH